jgi:hypothetical protein
MAEVTSGQNLTVIVLDEVEVEALTDLVRDYMEFHEDNILDGEAPSNASALRTLWEALA